MWKNCRAEIQGLYHYRRIISGRTRQRDKNDWQIVINEDEAAKVAITREKIFHELENADVILAAPFHADVLNTLECFRVHCYWKDIREMCSVIEKFYPAYVPALMHVLNGEYFSQCQMFIARRDFVNNYCACLFDVLSKVEQRISLKGYDADHVRTLAYMGEILLNVYVQGNNLRRKHFQRARIVHESKMKRILRKFPLVMKIFWALRDRKRRNYNELKKIFAVQSVI